jgi:hypothetical protein
VLTVKGALPGTLRPDRRELVNVNAGSFARLFVPPPAGLVLASRKVEPGRAKAQADGRQVPDVRSILLAVVTTKVDETPTSSQCNPRFFAVVKADTTILAADSCMGAGVRNCKSICRTCAGTSAAVGAVAPLPCSWTHSGCLAWSNPGSWTSRAGHTRRLQDFGEVGARWRRKGVGR